MWKLQQRRRAIDSLPPLLPPSSSLCPFISSLFVDPLFPGVLSLAATCLGRARKKELLQALEKAQKDIEQCASSHATRNQRPQNQTTNPPLPSATRLLCNLESKKHNTFFCTAHDEQGDDDGDDEDDNNDDDDDDDADQGLKKMIKALHAG